MHGDRDSHRYDDIINLPHPVSKKHPRMAAIDRAAQFSPFAALVGYGDAIKETARLTGERVELDEYEKAALNERLQYIADTVDEGYEVTVTYFVPDEKKSGGEYVTVTGEVRKIEEYERMLVMKDGQKIPIEEIIRLL